jgi:enoyl-[acyl-carrier protein] reductase/trans-2-enoyl-CoA reductase (NAD+)
MIIKPKIRGFICTTAHPTGCFKSVKMQVNYVKQKGKFNGPKNVLVIGASTGYGLASRIVPAFGSGANTIGVFYEKEPSEKRTASAGWYNSAAFEILAKDAGLYAKSINGDAFSDAIKEQTAKLIRDDLSKIELIVYSIASPRRIHPKTQQVHNSVLKTIGQPFTNKTVEPMTGEIKKVTIEPANEAEIEDTVIVMGGEDWEMWLDLLEKENLLADNCKTIAYSYIGPELTFPIYRDGTIGKAKLDLEYTAQKLNERLNRINGKALISVNKALVTQASSAIPIVPLYISILYRIMKDKGLHEGCIEQIYRLFADKLYPNGDIELDEQGRIRIDDYEMRDDVQQEVQKLWQEVNENNLETLTDIAGYREDFYHLFGFDFADIDYDADVNQMVNIPSLT